MTVIVGTLVEDSTNQTGHTFTVPTGVTSGMRGLFAIATGTSNSSSFTMTATGGTFTQQDQVDAGTTRVTIFTGTGVAAGATVTITSSASTTIVMGHLYQNEYTFGTLSSNARGASQNFTTTGGFTPTTGQKVLVVAVERTTTATTVSSVTSLRGETVTQRFYGEGATLQPSVYLGELTAAGTSVGSVTVTYSNSSANGYAASILTTPSSGAVAATTTSSVTVTAGLAAAVTATSTASSTVTAKVTAAASATSTATATAAASVSSLASASPTTTATVTAAAFAPIGAAAVTTSAVATVDANVSSFAGVYHATTSSAVVTQAITASTVTTATATADAAVSSPGAVSATATVSAAGSASQTVEQFADAFRGITATVTAAANVTSPASVAAVTVASSLPNASGPNLLAGYRTPVAAQIPTEDVPVATVFTVVDPVNGICTPATGRVVLGFRNSGPAPVTARLRFAPTGNPDDTADTPGYEPVTVPNGSAETWTSCLETRWFAQPDGRLLIDFSSFTGMTVAVIEVRPRW